MNGLIPHPEIQALVSECEKLRTLLSQLYLRRDNLKLQVVPLLEIAYMNAFGRLECRIMQVQNEALRLRRKIDLIQAAKNRNERPDITRIDELLEMEFKEYLWQLEEKQRATEMARKAAKERIPMTTEESEQVRRLYREIVKATHPDLHPGISKDKVRFFIDAQDAYSQGDIATLQAIATMLETAAPEVSADGVEKLRKELERLRKVTGQVEADIGHIQESFPLSERELLEDADKIAARKKELEEIFKNNEVVRDVYVARLNQMQEAQ